MDDDLKIAVFMILIFLLLPALLLFIVFKPGNGMLFVYLFSGFLALLGICIFVGKGMWFVAGFNTMSPKEKEEFENTYDIKKFQKTFGAMLLLSGMSMLLITTDLPVLISSFFIIGIILSFLIIMLVFQNRFIKK